MNKKRKLLSFWNALVNSCISVELFSDLEPKCSWNGNQFSLKFKKYYFWFQCRLFLNSSRIVFKTSFKIKAWLISEPDRSWTKCLTSIRLIHYYSTNHIQNIFCMYVGTIKFKRDRSQNQNELDRFLNLIADCSWKQSKNVLLKSDSQTNGLPSEFSRNYIMKEKMLSLMVH